MATNEMQIPSSFNKLPASTFNWQQAQLLTMVLREWALRVQPQLQISAARFQKGKPGSKKRPASGGPLLQRFPNIKQSTEHKLREKIDYRLLDKYGYAEGVGFRIQRHGAFVHKGVGRGYQMRGGMVVRVDGKGIARKKMERAIIGGPIKRRPVDWFNPIIDRNTGQLADQVAKINEDLVVNALRMRIN